MKKYNGAQMSELRKTKGMTQGVFAVKYSEWIDDGVNYPQSFFSIFERIFWDTSFEGSINTFLNSDAFHGAK